MMPRTVSASRISRTSSVFDFEVTLLCYHVLNRGNYRASVFHKDGDFDAFVDLLAEAKLRNPMRILAYCVLPNHFHLALWPLGDGDLGRWMHWLLTAHVRRYQRHYRSTGHVWQGRFKAFLIQEDEHLLVVPRYIERNPLRAGLVERAEDWSWSSLGAIAGGRAVPVLDPGPIPRPAFRRLGILPQQLRTSPLFVKERPLCSSEVSGGVV